MINKSNYKFPQGESWMDLKFRASRFLLRLQIADLNKPVLAFTHGGFISSLLYSKGHGKIPKAGAVVLVNYVKTFENDKECNKKFFSFKDDFAKLLNCEDERFNQKLFNDYNPVFEEYLKQNIFGVEHIYEIPDLTEEIF